MSTFSQLISKPGVGLAYYVDVSVDRFSTISYRYSTVTGKLDGTNFYDPRIVNLSKLTREMAAGHAMASSTISIALANEDGGVDWVSNRATVESSLFKSQWRLTAYVWDVATPTDSATKVLGIFTAMENPKRTAKTVSLTLADRILSDAGDFAMTPTLDDILSDLVTDAAVTGSAASPDQTLLLDRNMPLPLIFGNDYFETLQVAPFVPGVGQTYLAFIVCCTTDTTAVSGTEVDSLYIANESVPKTSAGSTVWDIRKSSTVTKDGRSMKVLYVRLHLANFFASPAARRVLSKVGLDPNTAAFVNSVDSINTILDEARKQSLGGVEVTPLYGSSITGVYSGAHVPRAGGVTGPDVVYDLLAYYSRGLSTSDINTASFTAATANLCFSWVVGSVNSQTLATRKNKSAIEPNGGALRRTINDICSACFFDVITGWDGLFYASVQGSSFAAQTATLQALDETLVGDDLTESVPSQGERWAYFNRLYFDIGEAEPLGPVDFTAAIASVGRVYSAVVNARWMPGRQSMADFAAEWLSLFGTQAYGRASIEPKVRPVLRFSYPLPALDLEIGDYVTLSWTRGGSLGPYTSSIFIVDGLSLDPLSAKVEVVLAWMDDLRSTSPYLLDSEPLLTRCSGTGGRSCTVTDGSQTVTFSSGNLISDGCVDSDLLILKDSSCVGTDFTRYRAVRIETIDSATSLTLVGTADLDFGTAGSHVVDAWDIVASDGTYPADLTNYPYGNLMYGRGTNSSGACSANSNISSLQGG